MAAQAASFQSLPTPSAVADRARFFESWLRRIAPDTHQNQANGDEAACRPGGRTAPEERWCRTVSKGFITDPWLPNDPASNSDPLVRILPLIDHNPRRGEKIAFAPHEAERFKERSTVERANARLKDEFGARHVRVRGATKVIAHLMFGVLALTADQLLRWVT